MNTPRIPFAPPAVAAALGRTFSVSGARAAVVARRSASRRVKPAFAIASSKMRGPVQEILLEFEVDRAERALNMFLMCRPGGPEVRTAHDPQTVGSVRRNCSIRVH